MARCASSTAPQKRYSAVSGGRDGRRAYSPLCTTSPSTAKETSSRRRSIRGSACRSSAAWICRTSKPGRPRHRSLRRPIRAYISPLISHADLGFAAVRWLIPTARKERAHGSAAAQPEKENGSTGFFHAPALGGWRSLRPSGPPLEPEDGGIHLRHPQQHPHHRSRPIRSDAAPRVAGGERHGRERRGPPPFRGPKPRGGSPLPPPPTGR